MWKMNEHNCYLQEICKHPRAWENIFTTWPTSRCPRHNKPPNPRNKLQWDNKLPWDFLMLTHRCVLKPANPNRTCWKPFYWTRLDRKLASSRFKRWRIHLLPFTGIRTGQVFGNVLSKLKTGMIEAGFKWWCMMKYGPKKQSLTGPTSGRSFDSPAVGFVWYLVANDQAFLDPWMMISRLEIPANIKNIINHHQSGLRFIINDLKILQIQSNSHICIHISNVYTYIYI